MSRHLLNTQYAQTADLKNQVHQVIKFLALNRQIVVPVGMMNHAFSIRPLMSTGINKLFEQCLQTEYINEFATVLPLIRKGESRTSLPDLLSWTNLTIDLKGNKDASVLDSYFELKEKIVVNVAELVKLSEDRGSQVSDINELHSMYVRGMFARSYYMSDMWLTPAICTYIIQTYCMAISSVIARNENLAYTEQMLVASLFALFFAQKMSPKRDDPSKPSLFYRCTFLGSMKELDDIATKVAHVSTNGLTVASVCELVAELGPSRLQKFNAGIFYRMCSSLGPTTDVISTRIAFEYPPYWLYMLMKVLDGYKAGSLVSYLKQHRLIGTESKNFVNALVTCRNLYDNK